MNQLSRLNTPELIAAVLWERYGPLAVVEAAVSASKAIEEANLDDCVVWRQVMDILETKAAETAPRH